MLQAVKSRVRDPKRQMISINLRTLGPGVYSASNRNEYQNQNNNVSAD
jgi:hypothetical protein